MKKSTIIRLFCISAFIFIAMAVSAQTDPFEADIAKMLQLNGSTSQDAIYDRIVTQMKKMKPEVSDEKWAAMKKDVFDPAMADLKKMLIPIYKKLFTQEEVAAILAFYETPAGKKLAETSGEVSKQSMAFTQEWGMSLMGKIQAYLN